MGVGAIIFGVIIGTIVTRNKTLDTSGPATAAPIVGNSTTVASCDTMMMNFTSQEVEVTMSVMSTITALEIQYAANVFEKTYGAMLANELAEAQADFCDPFCRKITEVVVSNNTLTTAAATATARQSGPSCNASLKLTFSVVGTWQGCEDTVWPGLFGAEGRRALQKNLRRILEEESEEDSCPVCPDGATTLGLVAPSTTQLKDTMTGFVAVLPAICELTDAQLIVAP